MLGTGADFGWSQESKNLLVLQQAGGINFFLNENSSGAMVMELFTWEWGR